MRQLDEQLSELEKLQQAAQLIEEMSQGRLQVCPSVVGQVYIRPQHDSNLGMDMRIDSISSILSEYNAQCQERDLTLGEEVTMC